MNKHTPGPWTTFPTFAHASWIIRDPDGEELGEFGPGGGETETANALLAAASPTLLAALIAIDEELSERYHSDVEGQRQMRGEPGDAKCESLDDAWLKIRTALARAKGRYPSTYKWNKCPDCGGQLMGERGIPEDDKAPLVQEVGDYQICNNCDSIFDYEADKT